MTGWQKRGFPNRRISDSWGGNRVGGCCDYIRTVTGLAGWSFRSSPRTGAEIQASPRLAVLHSRHRDRLQLVSRHRHLHRCPSPQAERDIRPEVAPCAGAHRHKLYTQMALYSRRRDGLTATCSPASGGTHNSRKRQYRAGWQDAAWQLRQFQRSCCRPGTERVRRRYVTRTRPRRYRREVQRDPRRPGTAGRTRRPGQRNRHTRCDTLSKKPSTSLSRPASD